MLQFKFNFNTIGKLQKKSQGILKTFVKMQTDLKAVNEKVKTEVDEKQKLIQSLTSEIDGLNTIGAANDKTIAKLDQFLND